jgi:glutamine amidotransferase
MLPASNAGIRSRRGPSMPDAPRPKIAIIDYQMGNLFSVENACAAVGLDARITSDSRQILAADAAILPGVGAFGAAMENLRKLDLAAPVKDYIASDRPFLGICLGLQLLFSESDEFGSSKGLDVIPGTVVRFPAVGPLGAPLRVPQIGWNRILPPESNSDAWRGSILDGITPGEFMYFVHSFYVAPENKDLTLSTTRYEGLEYCSSIRKGNLVATQFHPEKSASEGLKIYTRWASSITPRNG